MNASQLVGVLSKRRRADAGVDLEAEVFSVANRTKPTKPAQTRRARFSSRQSRADQSLEQSLTSPPFDSSKDGAGSVPQSVRLRSRSAAFYRLVERAAVTVSEIRAIRGECGIHDKKYAIRKSAAGGAARGENN
ncbi:hypothetical protein EVAR_4742_1 [Eumeta japonica]|uniref:Uncharacterized protein n=1 Tax=Eumeta variegata TaxID=151549 RepID=A0A4C1SYM0_EUMVA|nr:hypothetical protein EVAR_4742_1 [Eumeta japonica]